jgi:hypothetical protein
MKTGSLFTLLFAAALAVAVSAPLAAQSLHLAANVPFEFKVNGTTMPAGEYVFTNANDGSIVLIRSSESGEGAAALALSDAGPGRQDGNATVSFNRYGGTYFLATIWDGHSGSGKRLPRTRSEVELSRAAFAQRVEVTAYLARR